MDALSLLRQNRDARREFAALSDALDKQLAGPEGLVQAAFSEGRSAHEIANALGFSTSHVYQLRDVRY